MSKLVLSFFFSLLLIIFIFLLFVIFSPECPPPEYLVNDFGGCELVD